jgi:hypothetical protein
VPDDDLSEVPADYGDQLRREDKRRFQAEEKRKLKEGWRKEWVPPRSTDSVMAGYVSVTLLDAEQRKLYGLPDERCIGVQLRPGTESFQSTALTEDEATLLVRELREVLGDHDDRPFDDEQPATDTEPGQPSPPSTPS